MRAEWAELQLQVVNVLEQLNAWAARQAKREARAAARTLQPPVAEPTVSPVGSPKERKRALRARLSAARGLGSIRTPDPEAPQPPAPPEIQEEAG